MVRVRDYDAREDRWVRRCGRSRRRPATLTRALVDQVLVDEAEQETEVVTTGGTTVGVGRQSAGSGVGRCSRSRVARRWSTLPKAISTARRRSSSPRMSLRISRMSLRSSAWPPEICTLKAMTAATMVPMIHCASRLGTWAGYHRPLAADNTVGGLASGPPRSGESVSLGSTQGLRRGPGSDRGTCRWRNSRLPPHGGP